MASPDKLTHEQGVGTISSEERASDSHIKSIKLLNLSIHKRNLSNSVNKSSIEKNSSSGNTTQLYEIHQTQMEKIHHKRVISISQKYAQLTKRAPRYTFEQNSKIMSTLDDVNKTQEKSSTLQKEFTNSIKLMSALQRSKEQCEIELIKCKHIVKKYRKTIVELQNKNKSLSQMLNIKPDPDILMDNDENVQIKHIHNPSKQNPVSLYLKLYDSFTKGPAELLQSLVNNLSKAIKFNKLSVTIFEERLHSLDYNSCFSVRTTALKKRVLLLSNNEDSVSDFNPTMDQVKHGNYSQSMFIPVAFTKSKQLLLTIQIDSEKKCQYLKKDFKIAKCIGFIVTLLLENYFLEIDKNNYKANQKQLANIFGSLVSSNSISEMQLGLRSSLPTYGDFEDVSILAHDQSTGQLIYFEKLEISQGEKLNTSKFSTSKGISGAVIKSMEIFISENAKSEHKYDSFVDNIYNKEDVKNIIFIPLIEKKKAIGLVQFYLKNTPKISSEEIWKAKLVTLIVLSLYKKISTVLLTLELIVNLESSLKRLTASFMSPAQEDNPETNVYLLDIEKIVKALSKRLDAVELSEERKNLRKTIGI